MGRLHDAVCGMEGKKALLALCCWLLDWTFRSMPRYTWSVHIALILNSFRGHFCCGTVGSCPCCVTRYTLNPCHRSLCHPVSLAYSMEVFYSIKSRLRNPTLNPRYVKFIPLQ